MSATETSLVRKAKSGDTAAFEELIRLNSGKIYNLGLRLLGNREDAADLLQETFIKAYESLRHFREASAFSTWIYRIATNFAFMKMRKKKKKTISLDDFQEIIDSPRRHGDADWSRNPQAHLRNTDLKATLDDAIGALPPPYKTVFVLHDIEGLPVARVGEILSLSVPAVKSRIHRSRLFLRERLADYFHGGVS